jgi:hypothetical protein
MVQMVLHELVVVVLLSQSLRDLAVHVLSGAGEEPELQGFTGAVTTCYLGATMSRPQSRLHKVSNTK